MLYLLKTVFLEGTGRFNGLFRDIPIWKVFVSSRRIPFRPETKGNKTNTVSYSVFIWKKGYIGPMDVHLFDWKDGIATIL